MNDYWEDFKKEHIYSDVASGNRLIATLKRVINSPGLLNKVLYGGDGLVNASASEEATPLTAPVIYFLHYCDEEWQVMSFKIDVIKNNLRRLGYV